VKKSAALDFGLFTIENSGVVVRIGKILITLSLVAMLGGHWVLLQTVAWTTMLADNLCTQSLAQSVMHTFDGKHPCPLCKAIAASKKSEKKDDLSFQSQKMEFPPAEQNFILIGPSQFKLLPLANVFAESLYTEPLTPPPRGF
jgi:hypothetical protein